MYLPKLLTENMMLEIHVQVRNETCCVLSCDTGTIR